MAKKQKSLVDLESIETEVVTDEFVQPIEIKYKGIENLEQSLKELDYSTDVTYFNMLKQLNVEQTYLINLKRREDRLELVKNELINANIDFNDVKVIEAFDGKKLKVQGSSNMFNKFGAVSVYLTAILIFRDAVERGLETIAIFEDDATLHKDYHFNSFNFCKELKDLNVEWNILWLGFIERRLRSGESISKFIKNVDNPAHCHAIVFKGKELIKEIYEHISNQMVEEIDVYYASLSKRYKSLRPTQTLFYQRGVDSDINPQHLKKLEAHVKWAKENSMN